MVQPHLGQPLLKEPDAAPLRDWDNRASTIKEMSRQAAALRLLFQPLEVFARTEASGGLLLIGATLAALIWANSDWQNAYRELWAAEVRLGAKAFGLSKPLLLWINDLLMAVFFLLVGLEIKRELVVGELKSFRKAALPAVAAVGGMMIPATLFLLFAPQAPASRGWGVPMATDIAFALGCLRLLGQRIPAALLVMLTALAILDDLGAVLVIALFYSGKLSPAALLLTGALTLVLLAMNRGGVREPSWYLLAGLMLWVAVLKSGVHATVAGVILGLAIPARARYSRTELIGEARELLGLAETAQGSEAAQALETLERRLRDCESPLSRLEHALHPWVAYGIIPLFALANAGVDLSDFSWASLGAPVALGVFVGLFFGKQIGVFGFTWLAVKAGWVELPSRVGWRHLYGLSLLAGVGFTMSLFIAALAYGEGSLLGQQAKLGILAASLLSAISGLLVLGLARKSSEV